jgi:hypothetical protein
VRPPQGLPISAVRSAAKPNQGIVPGQGGNWLGHDAASAGFCCAGACCSCCGSARPRMQIGICKVSHSSSEITQTCDDGERSAVIGTLGPRHRKSSAKCEHSSLVKLEEGQTANEICWNTLVVNSITTDDQRHQARCNTCQIPPADTEFLPSHIPANSCSVHRGDCDRLGMTGSGIRGNWWEPWYLPLGTMSGNRQPQPRG